MLLLPGKGLSPRCSLSTYKRALSTKLRAVTCTLISCSWAHVCALMLVATLFLIAALMGLCVQCHAHNESHAYSKSRVCNPMLEAMHGVRGCMMRAMRAVGAPW